MENHKRHLIVVLGMHRSGTSVLTRSLQVVGVDLGDNLMPPADGNNAKGFWEDMDLYALNVEMLAALQSDWHHLRPIRTESVETLLQKGFLERGIELLRTKLRPGKPFGFKDPRVAILLPFWKEVFAHCDVTVDYILALRSPMSVAQSLLKRDKLDTTKSYLLWFSHVLSALRLSRNERFLIVDYDTLLQQPDREILRIGSFLNLAVEPAELEQYKSEFLDTNLRHSLHNSNDMRADSNCPPVVVDIYEVLREVASENRSTTDSEVVDMIAQWTTEIDRLEATLRFVDRVSCEALTASNHLEEQTKLVSKLSSELEEQTKLVGKLSSELEEQIRQTARTEDRLKWALEDVTTLEQSSAVIGKHRDSLSKELSAVYESTSWRITKPMRFFRGLIIKMTNGSSRQRIRRIVLTAWRALPLAPARKGVLKHWIFRLFPSLFRNTNAYRTWQHTRAASLKIDGAPTGPEPLRIEFDDTKETFTDYSLNPRIEPAVKLIAFYLPQFHPFPENDAWWGKGFTEWTNVGKALPNYEGHYQPHCPIHFGYYDLRIPQVMRDQAELAKNYGIHGFNYYFYWFAGKTLMEGPLQMMLNDPSIEMPFCLTWANENWTRRWDGQENDVLIAQEHSTEDSIAFIQHLIPYFKDKRYIRIDNKPVLTVYRADIIPNMTQTALLWRQELEKAGFDGLYLICAQTFGIREPKGYGCDAAMQFPPHTVLSHEIGASLNICNRDFSGQIFDYDEVVENALLDSETDYKLFRTAMLSWDNTARKQNNSHIFHGFSLKKYKQWLNFLCHKVARDETYSAEEKIVFINAWNEWAEGTHLEPDRKFGYGYLQATFDVVSQFDAINPTLANRGVKKMHDYAIVVHAHYDTVLPELFDYLDGLEIGFDLFVTSSRADLLNRFIERFPDCNVDLVENRGRDILPFLKTYGAIKESGYYAICKLHTKRSVYRDDGDIIRGDLYRSLIGNSADVMEIISRLEDDEDIGIIAPEKYLIPHNELNMRYNTELVDKLSKVLQLDFKYTAFPAGSMFWFRPQALESLEKLDDKMFGHEKGLVDGTVPHAVERLFGSVAEAAGYKVVGI